MIYAEILDNFSRKLLSLRNKCHKYFIALDSTEDLPLDPNGADPLRLMHGHCTFKKHAAAPGHRYFETTIRDYVLHGACYDDLLCRLLGSNTQII